MPVKDHAALLKKLSDSHESDWLEFKVNNANPATIGQTICALANAAMLQDREKAYLIFGIEDETRKWVGTDIVLATLKHGAENFINWISRMIEPRLMMEFIDCEIADLKYSIIVIEPTYDNLLHDEPSY